jgi:uncharacterized membrane protein YfcA
MDVYLPIAGLSVNALVIVMLGGMVGLLSGMFGVGGGFLTTPLLIFYGIPPAVAVASSATQITGASVSGVFAHLRGGGVDFTWAGCWSRAARSDRSPAASCSRHFSDRGRSIPAVALLYVVLLGSIGTLMAKEAIFSVMAVRRNTVRPAPRRHHPGGRDAARAVALLSLGLYISPLAPLLLGFATGLLTVLLGVGGGFVLVPR